MIPSSTLSFARRLRGTARLDGTLTVNLEIAPGDFRAVWDSGTKDRTRTQIHFGKLRVAEKP